MKNKILLGMVEIFLLAAMLFSAYKIIDIKMTEKRENDYFEQLRRNEQASSKVQNDEIAKETENQDNVHEYVKLHERNKDYIGWLSIPNTPVDYPVMNTPHDANYYLRKNFDKEYALSGTPYIGDGIGADKKSFVIYGHHMKNGTMFGTLEKYQKLDYKKEHSYIYFQVSDEMRKYEVITAFYVNLDDEHFDFYHYYGDLSKKSFETFVRKLSKVSIYGEVKDIEYEDQILMLSTCSYFVEDGRFVVVAKRVE